MQAITIIKQQYLVIMIIIVKLRAFKAYYTQKSSL